MLHAGLGEARRSPGLVRDTPRPVSSGPSTSSLCLTKPGRASSNPGQSVVLSRGASAVTEPQTRSREGRHGHRAHRCPRSSWAECETGGTNSSTRRPERPPGPTTGAVRAQLVWRRHHVRLCGPEQIMGLSFSTVNRDDWCLAVKGNAEHVPDTHRATGTRHRVARIRITEPKGHGTRGLYLAVGGCGGHLDEVGGPVARGALGGGLGLRASCRGPPHQGHAFPGRPTSDG